MRRSVRYSQNFLQASPFVAGLVNNSSVSAADTVLDIGAGSGVLTGLLARRAAHVIAVEPDQRLAAKLAQEFSTNKAVAILPNDFLSLPLPAGPYKVFANIPFNRTNAIMHKLLDSGHPPLDSYLFLQQEAAEKFAGLPGRHSLFAILHAPWFRITIRDRLKPEHFHPRPSVMVVLLQAARRQTPLIPLASRSRYEDFVAYAFNHANPNLALALRQLFGPPELSNIQQLTGQLQELKPTQLAPETWLTLFRAFVRNAGPRQYTLINGTAKRLQAEGAGLQKIHRTSIAKDWRLAQPSSNPNQ